MTAVQQAATTDPNGPTGRLATWVADVTLDDVPRDVVERAKHLLLDGIGCALIGSQLPWSRVATSAVLDLESNGDVAVIGTGQSTSGPAARGAQRHLHSGFRARRLPPDRPGAQLLAGHPRTAVHGGRAAGSHDRRGLSARGNHRLRGRPAGRLHAARHADARPRLALGAGLRHSLRGNGIRQDCADCHRHSWRMRWAWPAPSRRG